jgi:hypothetical protein
MSQQYYRYNTDDAPIDIDNDEIYDYVLEREALKELDNVGPKCVRDIEGHEHFGNLKGGSTNDLMRNVFIVLLVVVMLYLMYCFLCDNKENEIKPGNYQVRFSY